MKQLVIHFWVILKQVCWLNTVGWTRTSELVKFLNVQNLLNMLMIKVITDFINTFNDLLHELSMC